MKYPLANNLVDSPPLPGIRWKSPIPAWEFFEIARIESYIGGCTHAAFREHAAPPGLAPLPTRSPLDMDWSTLSTFASPLRPERTAEFIDRLLQTERSFDTNVVCLTPRTEETRYLDEELGIDAITLVTSPIRFPRPWMQKPYPHTWLIEWREPHDEL